jgi:quercetin dioxygenase-like cupin family protein
MELFHSRDHQPQPADPLRFSGDATMARMDLSGRPELHMYRVAFQPSARTAWHAHSGMQLLLVIEGRCRIQKDGEPIQEVAAGGAIRIEAGERHWHGATADAPMTHLALNVDAATDWFEKVTDDQYGGRK